MRKILCVILVLTLCFTCVPFSACAEEASLKIATADIFSRDFGYDTCRIYFYQDDCYMSIADIARYTRSAYVINEDMLVVTHGTRRVEIDLSSNTLSEGGVVSKIKTVRKGEDIIIHAFPMLSYLGADCEVSNELLTIMMPQYTIWEGLEPTGHENQYSLDTFGGEVNRGLIFLVNGVLKVLEGGLSEALCNAGKKEALVCAMQVDPLKYNGAWEIKSIQDAKNSSLASTLLSANDFVGDQSELFGHVYDFFDSLGFDYLEKTSANEFDYIAELKCTQDLMKTVSVALSFFSNMSENEKCTDDSVEMIRAFKNNAPYTSKFRPFANDVIGKAAGGGAATLDAAREVVREKVVDKLIVDKAYEQLELGKVGYFSVVDMVEASIDISVLINKFMFGDAQFEFAEAQTSALNLMYLKYELEDTIMSLGNQMASGNYSNAEDIEDYRLLKAFYYKVQIATYEQFKKMIVSKYGEDSPRITDDLASLDEAINAFSKRLHILTLATGSAFPDLESISSSNEWDNCRELKDRATEITEADDLAMYHLSMQSGQYAISGDYKYYTIQNESGEMEPTGDLYKENIETGERILLKKNTLAQFINVVNDKVFYTLYGSGPYNVGVHMISTDGTGYKKLSDQMVCSLVADDTYVYFAEDPFATEFSAGINRIAYNSDDTNTETVVPSVSGYVYDINLLSGRLVYSEVKTAVDMNTRIVIFDLSSKSKTIINDGDGNPEVFEEMWVHGNYIYILKWHGHFYGSCAEYELSEAMKRDLYRYNLTTKEYEICELPVANCEELFAGYYIGDIYSDILDAFEKELPSDFENSTQYIFESVD